MVCLAVDGRGPDGTNKKRKRLKSRTGGQGDGGEEGEEEFEERGPVDGRGPRVAEGHPRAVRVALPLQSHDGRRRSHCCCKDKTI